MVSVCLSSEGAFSATHRSSRKGFLTSRPGSLLPWLHVQSGEKTQTASWLHMQTVKFAFWAADSLSHTVFFSACHNLLLFSPTFCWNLKSSQKATVTETWTSFAVQYVRIVLAACSQILALQYVFSNISIPRHILQWLLPRQGSPIIPIASNTQP